MEGKQKQIVIKKCSGESLYNMKQDGRHTAIIDLRSVSHFLNSFVANSYCYFSQPQNNRNLILNEFLDRLNQNAIEQEKKENRKKIRRFLFIGGDQVIIRKILNSLEYNFFDFKVSKIYHLPNFYDFRNEFDFLCLGVTVDDLKSIRVQKKGNFKKKKKVNQEITKIEDKIKENREDQEEIKGHEENILLLEEEIKLFENGIVPFNQIQQMLLRNQKNKVLLANSQFPLKIVKNGVYLGTRNTMNSLTHLKALGIKKCVEFYYDKKKHNTVERKEKKYFETLIINLDVNKLIDFESICKEIHEFKGKEKLMFVRDNLETSVVFLIAYLMVNEGKGLNIASLRVFAVLGSTNCEKLCYNQLMNYRPGQIKRYS